MGPCHPWATSHLSSLPLNNKILVEKDKTMQFVNLTPHTLNVHTNKGEIIEVSPSGNIARVATTYTPTKSIGDIDIFDCIYGEVTGLPEQVEGTCYIVSGQTNAALSHREDVFSPGELVRDEAGKPIGCLGLKA